MDILQFKARAVGSPLTTGASRLSIWRTLLHEWFCRLLNRMGLPGAVQETTIEDSLTGQIVRVSVGTLFTRISVNGRDFYFRRISGRFDGTGSGCR